LLALIFTALQIWEENIIAETQLAPGNIVEQFELVDLDGKAIDSATLLSSKYTIFFIFKRPCPTCDSNIFLWKKMARAYKDKVTAIGIALSDIKAVERLKSIKKINFPILLPADLKGFEETFKLKFDLSQTTLFYNGKVVFNRRGELNAEEYLKIKKIISGG
jgi:peroxiredoxin